MKVVKDPQLYINIFKDLANQKDITMERLLKFTVIAMFRIGCRSGIFPGQLTKEAKGGVTFRVGGINFSCYDINVLKKLIFIFKKVIRNWEEAVLKY